MATIQLTIPDDKLDLVIDTFCTAGNYQDEILDPDWNDPADGTPHPVITNPQSKAAFARAQLYKYIRARVVQQRAAELEEGTRQELATIRDDISVITE
jgi:hypothetical protein